MASNNKSAFADKNMLGRAIKDSFVKLNPKTQVQNPVMLLVYISAIHHGQRVFKLPVVLEQGQQSGQLLAGEEVLLAHVLDAAAGHSDELPVSRDLEPSGLRQLLRADGHGVGQTVPSLVPHDGLQLLSLFLVGQVSALLHQGGYEPVVHVLVDDRSRRKRFFAVWRISAACGT